MTMISCPLCFGAGFLSHDGDEVPVNDRRFLSEDTFLNPDSWLTTEPCSSPGAGHDCNVCGNAGQIDDGATDFALTGAGTPATYFTEWEYLNMSTDLDGEMFGVYRPKKEWVDATNPASNFAVLHSILAFDMGQNDDVRIKVRWLHTYPDDDDLYDGYYTTLGQIGPLAHCDPDSAPPPDTDDMKLGWGPVNDVGIGGAGYILNGFRSDPESEVLKTDHVPDYYEVQAGSGKAASFFPLNEDNGSGWEYTEITMELLGDGTTCNVQWGSVMAYEDHTYPVIGSQSNLMGVHYIGIHPKIGGNHLNFTTGEWTGPTVTELPEPYPIQIWVETI